MKRRSKLISPALREHLVRQVLQGAAGERAARYGCLLALEEFARYHLRDPDPHEWSTLRRKARLTAERIAQAALAPEPENEIARIQWRFYRALPEKEARLRAIVESGGDEPNKRTDEEAA
jgi:hypothetical protein